MFSAHSSPSGVRHPTTCTGIAADSAMLLLMRHFIACSMFPSSDSSALKTNPRSRGTVLSYSVADILDTPDSSVTPIHFRYRFVPSNDAPIDNTGASPYTNLKAGASFVFALVKSKLPSGRLVNKKPFASASRSKNAASVSVISCSTRPNFSLVISDSPSTMPPVPDAE